MTEAEKRAVNKYFKKNIRQVVIKLNKATDEDLIEYVDSLDNIQGEIKKIMRARVQKQIFTNQQINTIKELIDKAVNENEFKVEELENDKIKYQEALDVTPIDSVKKRKQMLINDCVDDIKRLNNEINKYEELRKYIDELYYK